MGAQSLGMIGRLVAFDTTSRDSNLALIHFVRDHLADLGVTSQLVHNSAGTKANLYATVGPADRPGVVLSGHTDVVPVDGQPWSTDPFHASLAGGKLYGRGTCDMKGFVAICLDAVPEMLRRSLQAPVHLAFSYDEEVGCLGVRRLIEVLDGMAVKPRYCIVGEPTSMKVARAHKGIRGFRCRVRGCEAHSSLTHQGVNAIEIAAELIGRIRAIARRFRDEGPYDPAFDPPYTTLNTGLVEGGTAVNIVPRDCSFRFEMRPLPGQDTDAILATLRRFADETLLPEMRAVAAEAAIEWEQRSHVPGLMTDEVTEVVTLAKRLAQANETIAVPYTTEAGLFDGIGIPTVVCGPGSIEQAHKPDEYIELEQIEAGEAFIGRLMDRMCASA